LKKFGVGLASLLLASLGLAHKASAAPTQGFCRVENGVQTGFCVHKARSVKIPCPRPGGGGNCSISVCDETASPDCIAGLPAASTTDEVHCQKYFSSVACQ